MIIPNFFIIGAPKCGTTALYEYLRMHPAICMSSIKEPHYFATDFNWKGCRHHIESLDNYINLFRKCTGDEIYFGEASVWYLYSQEAIKRIYQFNKDAKIIVMLRNPVDMLHSLHSEQLYGLQETETDFEKSWTLQFARKNGSHIPKTCREPKFLQYSEIGKFSAQLKRLFQIFPCNQIKVILFDDFIVSTKFVYEDVLSFLEIPSDNRSHFPKINENKINKSIFIAYLINADIPIKNIMNKFFDKIKYKFDIEDLKITKFIMKINAKKIIRAKLRTEFREYLINYFYKDIEELEYIYGIDLTLWKKL